MSNADLSSLNNVVYGQWRDVLESRGRKRLIGRLAPHIGKAALLDTFSAIDPAIDTSNMSATAVISTPTPDRSEDVVEPLGAQLENYARNPVVFFDHGFSGIHLPVAKSEDPDGRLTVVVTADGIEATSYFAQNMCEACQIFELIEQRIIRSTSINMTPLIAKVRSDGSGERPGLHIQEWELLEWSWVGIPDNPEAVRKVLERGKLAGRAICEPIRKSLGLFVERLQRRGKGFSLKDGSMSDDELALSGRSHVDITDGTLPDEEDPDDTPDDADLDIPHGAKTLTHAFHGLSVTAKALEDDVETMEHPDVKAFCKKLVKTLHAAMDEIQACHRSHYPERAELNEQLDDGADLNETVKFLAADSRASRYFIRMLSRLKSLGRAGNLNPEQRATIRLVTGRMEAIINTSRLSPLGAKSQAELDWFAHFNDRLGLIEKKMTNAAAKLLEAIPHRQTP